MYLVVFNFVLRINKVSYSERDVVIQSVIEDQVTNLHPHPPNKNIRYIGNVHTVEMPYKLINLISFDLQPNWLGTLERCRARKRKHTTKILRVI